MCIFVSVMLSELNTVPIVTCTPVLKGSINLNKEIFLLISLKNLLNSFWKQKITVDILNELDILYWNFFTCQVQNFIEKLICDNTLNLSLVFTQIFINTRIVAAIRLIAFIRYTPLNPCLIKSLYNRTCTNINLSKPFRRYVEDQSAHYSWANIVFTCSPIT
jgi:hypothetical protein